MNERIRELARRVVGKHRNDVSSISLFDEQIEKFAELIVRECADVIQKEVSMKYKDGGETEEFMGGHYASSLLARVKIKRHFGVEETKGWVCPKCGTDRTKAVCPKGHHAALTGDCPMIGVAQ